MNVTLENENFIVVIGTLGAEIQSLTRKKDGTEFIWNGDSSIWKNHAPILFPFVCRCLGDHYQIDGKDCVYTKNHGFARDLETKIILQTKTKAVFELTDSEETLYRYPYHFSLQTEYEVVENGLNWKITVNNTDSKAFKFSLGTHAAFCCPRNTDPAGTQNSDYVIEFENHEKLTRVATTPDNFLKVNENGKVPYTYPNNEAEAGIIPLNENGFGNGHLFTDYTSSWVGLRNRKDNSLIRIDTKGFPYTMLWQNTAGKPSFVCIEPWYGAPDSENTDHIWEHKIGLVDLPAGQKFESIQNIRIE